MKEERRQEVSSEPRTDGAAGRMDLGLLVLSAWVLKLQVLETKSFVSTARTYGLD
jgi:hypothetical protein